MMAAAHGGREPDRFDELIDTRVWGFDLSAVVDTASRQEQMALAVNQFRGELLDRYGLDERDVTVVLDRFVQRLADRLAAHGRWPYPRSGADSGMTSVVSRDQDTPGITQLMGSSRIMREIARRQQQSNHELTIAWVSVPPDTPVPVNTVGQLGDPAPSSASVLAVISDGVTTELPAGDVRLHPGDVVVVLARPGDHRRVAAMFQEHG